MKKTLFLFLALVFVTGCSQDSDDGEEHFSPQPGGISENQEINP